MGKPSRFRMWLADRLLSLSWMVGNPHDDWAIEWTYKGHTFGDVSTGHYWTVRALCRERKARIVGNNARKIGCDA